MSGKLYTYQCIKQECGRQVQLPADKSPVKCDQCCGTVFFLRADRDSWFHRAKEATQPVPEPEPKAAKMYPKQCFYSVMCPRGDKTAHVVVMGMDVAFYLSLGWVEQYRLKVKEWHVA